MLTGERTSPCGLAASEGTRGARSVDPSHAGRSSTGDPPPETPTSYRGRRLLDVLEELRERGLRLIYSTAVVGEDLVVTVEPLATEPRAILDEVLAPLGLEAREGPSASILIVIVGAASEERFGTLKGRIISSARGSPIVRALVTVAGTEASANSGPDGSFEISRVPPGTYDLIVESPDFLPATLTRVRIAPGGRAEVVVPLEARPSYVAEVIVTPGLHSVMRQEQAPRLTIGHEDAVLVPTIGGDISRVIELLPGVAAPDHSAAFNVRGSGARDVSLVLDGFELYDPFHLQSFQSPFSLIDSKIIDTIEFIGGGFTADFGDRFGGFVELSTEVPGAERRGKIELGTLNSRFSYGAPMSRPSGSWLVSGRTWYPEALRDTIELGETGVDPRFGDAYLKASFNLSDRTVLSTHGLLAWDHFEFREPGGAEEVDSSNRSSYVWLRALRSSSEDLYSQTTVSAGRLDRRRDGLSEPEDEVFVVSDDRQVNILGGKHDLTWRISASHLLRAGVDVRRLSAHYRYASGLEGQPASTRFRLDPRGTSYGAYVAHRAAVGPKVAAEVGLRWDRQSYLGDGQLSPRLNAFWNAGERSEVRVGLGRYFQSQRIHELRVEDGETSFFPAELSEQAEVTLLHALRGGLRLRMDAYYRRLSRLYPRYENLFNPIELFPETELDRVLVPADRARLRGVELLVRSSAKGPLDWWVSYAWSSADDIIDGHGVPRSWDQTHAGKFLVGYRRDDRWFVSMSGMAHTGWPTTPVTGRPTILPGGSPGIEAVRGPRNSERFPAYLRFDLKASRAFPLPRGRLRLEAEVVNVTDRDNICCVDEFRFEPRSDGTINVDRQVGYWLGITPSFSVLWEF